MQCHLSTRSHLPSSSSPPPDAATASQELPPVDIPLAVTAQQYAEFHAYQKSLYLDYMHTGQFPDGPYDDSQAGKDRLADFCSLVSQLAKNGQDKAMHWLLQRAAPLPSLSLDVQYFSPVRLQGFLDALGQNHPALGSLLVMQRDGSCSWLAEHAPVLARFIERSPDLKRLEFPHLDDQCTPALMSAVTKHGRIEALMLGTRGLLGEESCAVLASAISGCPALAEVSLMAPHLAGPGEGPLLSALGSLTALKRLHFGFWRLRDEVNFAALSKLIADSTSLQTLTFGTLMPSVTWSLSGRSELAVREAEYATRLCQAFADGVGASRSLRSVEFLPSQASDEGTLALLGAARRNVAITALGIPALRCQPPAVLEELADLLDANTALAQINCPDDDFFACAWLASPDTFVRHYEDNVFSESYFDSDGIKSSGHKHLLDRFRQARKKIIDRLARNRALQQGQLVNRYSRAFFPASGTMPGPAHLGDPGIVLTEEILRQSANLKAFRSAMVEIALSVDATARAPRQGDEDDPNAFTRIGADEERKPDSGQ